jgi:hypothetical protein
MITIRSRTLEWVAVRPSGRLAVAQSERNLIIAVQRGS